MMFRPSLLSTVFIGACVLTQLRLAWWQWERHEDQTARHENVAERMANDPASNEDMDGTTDALQWRKATLTGRFEDAKAFITGRFEFGEPGFDVIGVLDLEGGPRVLVNRGWIPLVDYETYLGSVPPGQATVAGLLLPADRSMLASRGCGGTVDGSIPARDGMPDRWAGPNWPAIAEELGAEGLAPVVLIAGPELTRSTEKVRDPLPAVGWIARPKHIAHLEYTWQWILIAAVFTFGWAYLGYRRALGETSERSR